MDLDKCPQQGPKYVLKHVSKAIKMYKIPTHLIFHKISGSYLHEWGEDYYGQEEDINVSCVWQAIVRLGGWYY